MRTPVFFDQLLPENNLPNNHKLSSDQQHTPRIASNLNYADSIVKRRTSHVTKNSTTTVITDYFKKSTIVPAGKSGSYEQDQDYKDFYHGKKLIQNTHKKYNVSQDCFGTDEFNNRLALKT